ncbi:purine-binding chemotaxis protein CheW [Azospirillum fermentarium]|uniref:chemotaxis protein CheW n=1 Tax=Azospirillum fermentarium TaxID=1233114 RepID=UPI00222616DB|nr:chemotaxis protein CheW [Azospirillum fermentarium]MCW2245484.1 purine-binding chemotaxis protein CheW [Azospirillum fermentarium]
MSNSTALATVGAVRTDVAMVTSAEEQYVTFTVGTEEYGVNILSVREIRGWTPESRLPNLPPYVRGVINLRGIIIPIFDLRARFGGGATDVTKRHVVVVIQVGERTRGILVDAISDILTIRRDDIKPPPDVEAGMIDAEYLSGLYTADSRMVTLLSVERLFATETGDVDPAKIPV